MTIHIHSEGPVSVFESLRVDQEVFFTGTVYMMRDQAHKRFSDALRRKEKPPFDIRGAVIYYCGPAKTPHGSVIGSCGPTTSSRMDAFTPLLLECGMRAMIGKGARSQKVIDAVRRHKAVYFLAPAGCGALLAEKIKKVTIVGYRGLGPEAIRKCVVEDFPLLVGIDSSGRSLYGAK